MAASDWTYLRDGLDIATVDRGVTAGVPRPPGGGDFLFAFHSLTTAPGAVALFVNQDGFSPMAKGASIRGVVQRGPGGGPLGFSPFLFAAGQGTSVHDVAYLLGLSDEDPHRLVLRKGAVVVGVPRAEAPGSLLASSASYVQATWMHVRLDVIVNPNGDVVLQAFENDLVAHPLGSPPVWQPVPGMGEIIDDHLGINTGSQPLIGGRAGFGFAVAEPTRRGYFDHLELLRQV